MPLAGALGLVTLEVPLPLPPIAVAPAWHPRRAVDPVRAPGCAAAYGSC
ncbi:hypothetical protein ABZ646_31935 [Streptomyces sp. NPDC007162]